MEASHPVYSVPPAPGAAALREGDAAAVGQALRFARARTLLWADAYEQALGTGYPGVPYLAELNPPRWELGHVAWFQEYWIGRNRQRQLGIACDPGHERPPAALADADAWFDSSRVAHAARWKLPLPPADAIRDYLARTLERTQALLDRLPATAGAGALYFFRLVALHEAMHAEAAAYMAQNLGIAGPVSPDLRPDTPPGEVLAVPAQRFRLGSAATGFAFDNELKAHEVAVDAFEIDAAPVTWGRFLRFVEAGGYDRREFWSDAGWQCLAQRAQRMPRYLRDSGNGWQQRRGADWIDLDPSQPAVHLDAHEAEAWCRWAGRRLPSEAEWECAALTQPGLRWGSVWEWTATAFQPYAGFQPHPYRDYSAPWFGTRRVLRGSCAATLPFLADARYRNFFEPHRNDIFAGFRSCAALPCNRGPQANEWTGKNGRPKQRTG